MVPRAFRTWVVVGHVCGVDEGKAIAEYTPRYARARWDITNNEESQSKKNVTAESELRNGQGWGDEGKVKNECTLKRLNPGQTT